jgi:hypothetical protein
MRGVAAAHLPFADPGTCLLPILTPFFLHPCTDTSPALTDAAAVPVRRPPPLAPPLPFPAPPLLHNTTDTHRSTLS